VQEATRTIQGTASRQAGGAVAVLLSAALWGSTGTAAHFAPAGASPVSIGAARIVLGGVLLATVALAQAQGRQQFLNLLRRGRAGRAALALGAVAIGGYQLCFFSAVRDTGVAVGTVVAIGSAPVFTGVLARMTGGPAPGRRWAIATAAAVAGCAVLITGGRASGVNSAGVALALAAGLCYAIYAVTAAGLISGGASGTAVMGTLFGAAAVLLAPVLATSPGWLLTMRGTAVTIYLGVITTVVAYLLYGRGLRTVPAAVAVTIGLAEPAVAALLGLAVLGERLTASGVAGLLLVGLALAVLIVGRPAGLPAQRPVKAESRRGNP
jgi:drug/metabolite transporter, DME family